MKKPFIKFFDKIILLLLGFSGMFYASCMYGMPVDEYEINGVVTDKSLTPIKDIRIINERDTFYTDPWGRYVINSWYNGNLVRLQVDDIDGVTNGGLFKSQEVLVQFTEADIVQKAKGNKRGNKFVKTQNIKLIKENINIPMYGAPVAPFEPIFVP